jgi:hypothetical protein
MVIWFKHLEESSSELLYRRFICTVLTYLRSSALPEKVPIVQQFREFPAILRNPKVHHRVHKSPPLVHTLSQFHPVHIIPSYLSLILSTHLCLSLRSGLFPSGFPTNILYSFLVSPIRATCPAHPLLLDLIILIRLARNTSYMYCTIK